MSTPSIPAGHFMSVGNRVESTWNPGRLGTVIRDLGDRVVLVDWDDSDVPTACDDDNLDPAPPAAIGRGMQAHVRVNMPDHLDDLLRRTGGEYPVSGDLSRTRFTLWKQFRFPSVWKSAGVGKPFHPADARR